MRRIGAVLLVSIVAVATLFSTPAPQSAGPEIKLILLIAVDQFRYDYLTRFRSDYTGGFKRLLTEGAVFTDANLEHYPTVTAPGHATMLTGAYPSASGIIGNDWFDRDASQQVTSVSDPGAKTVGSATTEGARSPKRLLVSTVGDELKKASKAKKGSPEAPHVIGVSLKDRAAILPAGKDADAAYWLDTKSGNFVSSSYYVSKPPDWLTAFNDRKIPDSFAGKPWSVFERPADSFGVMPAAGSSLYESVYGSPFGGDLLLAFADAVLTEEKLGQRGVTDLLTVSFSSNDAVGHTWGPDAPRVKDISIRTDLVIAKLLDRVDALVGLSHTVVAFTSDHGVAPLPETRQEAGLSGGRMASNDVFNPIQQALAKRFGDGKWVLGTAGTAPYLNYDLITRLALDQSQVRRTAAEAVTAVPHVAKVYTRDQLLRKSVPDDVESRRVLHGFNAARNGDLEILLEPYWLRQATGSTHGTPYEYDAHIPLILMGPMIKAGEYTQPVALNDLAPTLSAIAGIKAPSGSAGRVLKEILK